MPTSGSASYSGLAGFANRPDFDKGDIIASADVSMTASFSATGGSVSGSMTNFLALDQNDETTEVEALRGSLAINEAAFTGNAFSTTISGQLTDSEGPFNVTGSMDARFVGDEGAAIGASMVLSDGDDDGTIFGALVAEKQ